MAERGAIKSQPTHLWGDGRSPLVVAWGRVTSRCLGLIGEGVYDGPGVEGHRMKWGRLTNEMGAFDHVRMVSPPQRSLAGEVRAALALGYSPRCFSLQVRRSAELFGRSGPCADSAGQAAETTAQTHLETCVAEEHHKAYSAPFVDFSAVSWSCHVRWQSSRAPRHASFTLYLVTVQ